MLHSHEQFLHILTNTWYNQSSTFSHSNGCRLVAHCVFIYFLTFNVESIIGVPFHLPIDPRIFPYPFM